MALTATASQGFEIYRETNGIDEVLWVPGDPGDTYTRGDVVSIADTEPHIDLHAAGEVPVGVVRETTVCTANTTGYPKVGPNRSDAAWGDLSSDIKNTLVPVMPFLPRGTPVLKVTFASQTDDENITSWTASTRALVVAAVAGDNDARGGLLYVYGGVGVGQWNTIDSTASATNTLTLSRTFETALTAASDVIYLGGAVGDDAGISFFKQVTAADQNNLTAADGATDGEFRVLMDAREVGLMLGNLMLPVIPSALLYHA